VLLAAAVIVLLLSMRVRKYPTYASSEALRQLDPTQVDEHTINLSVGYLYLKMRDGIQGRQRTAGEGFADRSCADRQWTASSEKISLPRLQMAERWLVSE
jgi:hypothetical protein